MERLMQKILRLCREYEECRVEVERREEARKVRNALETVCVEARQRLDISEPGLLVALMDLYEVTRDEEMLQEILDMVSGNLEQLPVAAETVKLLAYCYYYVEEEECAVKAREILEQLRQRRGNDGKVKEMEKILEEMLGEEEL